MNLLPIAKLEVIVYLEELEKQKAHKDVNKN
jgi:hypothetical protein